MLGKRNRAGKGRHSLRSLRVPLLFGACAAIGMLVAPTVGNALADNFNDSPVSLAARGGIGSFTPASVDPRLSSQITKRALRSGILFRFTPAGTETRPDRAVTVVVRVGDLNPQALSVRSALPASATAPGAAPVRIAPSVFNLGMARGYQSFAPTAGSTAGLPNEIQRLDVPDLRAFGSKFANSTSVASVPARLAPRVEIDHKERLGRLPRTLESQSDYQVDLGGSYRLTRNFDVTAGVRYSSERDRLRPLTDGKQDSQAVYVGTKFRF
jgi:hypothetical protein